MLSHQFDFTTAIFPDLESVDLSEVKQADIVTILQRLEGGIYHSSHMRWITNLQGLESLEEVIRSKKVRKKIKESYTYFEEKGYQVTIKQMNEADYAEFKSLYQETTLQKNRAIFHDISSSILGRILCNVPVYIVGLYKENKLESGLVFSISNQTTVVSFGAKKKFTKVRGGIGGVLEEKLIQHCLENNLLAIDHGKNINPIGLVNKAGLFEFKSRYGNTAYPEGSWRTSFILNTNISLSDMVYITLQDNELQYLVLTDTPTEENKNKYSTRNNKNILQVEKSQIELQAKDFFNL